MTRRTHIHTLTALAATQHVAGETVADTLEQGIATQGGPRAFGGGGD